MGVFSMHNILSDYIDENMSTGSSKIRIYQIL